MILATTILSSANILVESAALALFGFLVWLLHDTEEHRWAGTITMIIILGVLLGIVFGKVSITIY